MCQLTAIENHANVNKSMHMYVCDVCQLFNPDEI